MKLTLTYRGPLKSNGDAATKHTLRRHFHAQLKLGIESTPYFVANRSRWCDPDWFQQFNSVPIGGHKFLPLVGSHILGVDTSLRYESTIKLDILMLRPGRAGTLLIGGDIDNRLKTLFDSLQIPDHNQAGKLTSSDIPESPMYCLMSNDNLITDVAVNTAQLLELSGQPDEVLLLVTATIDGGLALTST